MARTNTAPSMRVNVAPRLSHYERWLAGLEGIWRALRGGFSTFVELLKGSPKERA